MRAVDGTRIKESLTCARIPFLDFQRGDEEPLPPTDRMRVLFDSGRRHEERILEGIAPEHVRFERGDFAAGERATRELIARRVPVIANGVLRSGSFLGRPDLLLWNDAEQRYEIADVKSTQTVHASAMLQVAFYSKLLAAAEPAPARGHLILRDASRVTFPLADVAAGLDRLVERLLRFRADPGADPGAHHAEACADCRWRDPCRAELDAAADPSLVPGLTRAQKSALAAAGVADLGALGGLEGVRRVAQASGLPGDLIRRLRSGARAVLEGRPVRRGVPRPELAQANVALAALLDARHPRPLVAIAGRVPADASVFRVRWLRERESADPTGEFRTLLTNLVRSRGPILVFGPGVRRALEEGVDLLPRAAAAIEDLLARLVDLRAELRRAVALPGFDRTPLLAARSAGLAGPDDDAEAGALEIAALRWLEEEPGAEQGAVERLLRRELDWIVALRAFVLRADDPGIAQAAGSRDARHAVPREPAARADAG